MAPVTRMVITTHRCLLPQTLGGQALLQPLQNRLQNERSPVWLLLGRQAACRQASYKQGKCQTSRPPPAQLTCREERLFPLGEKVWLGYCPLGPKPLHLEICFYLQLSNQRISKEKCELGWKTLEKLSCTQELEWRGTSTSDVFQTGQVQRPLADLQGWTNYQCYQADDRHAPHFLCLIDSATNTLKFGPMPAAFCCALFHKSSPGPQLL